MNRAEVLRMAMEVGHPYPEADAQFLVDFAALVAADARAARIAAQVENEALKARLAASGVAERRAVRDAVLAEREACAALVASWNTAITDKLAADIRARGAA